MVKQKNIKMLKHLVFSSFLFNSLGFAQIKSEQISAPKTNLADFHLTNNVRFVQIKSVDYYNQQVTTGFLDNEYFNQVEYHFNANGNLINRTNYLEYGNRLGIYSIENYQYNPQNFINQYEKIIVNNGEDPKRVEELKTYSYSNNRLIREDYTHQSKSKKTTYQTLYEYQNNLTKITDQVEQVKNAEVNFTYNPKNELVQSQTTLFNGKKGQTEFLISNEKGQPIAYEKIINNQKTYVFEDYSNHKTTRQYFDNQLNLIKEEVFQNNDLIRLKKKENESQNSLSTFTFDYQYDSFGNWITCLVKRNGSPYQTISRQIKY